MRIKKNVERKYLVYLGIGCLFLTLGFVAVEFDAIGCVFVVIYLIECFDWQPLPEPPKGERS